MVYEVSTSIQSLFIVSHSQSHSSMESGKKKLRFEDLAARYNKLVIIFKLFFISLTLIIIALITYLVRTELSEQSIHNNNNNPSLQTSESEVFKVSLQRAAQELENATALLLSDHPTEATFTRCREWLQTGSGQIREAIRADPFPQTPSSEQRAEMSKRVVAAESYVEWCLDDLGSVAESSAAAGEVRERVLAAAGYLRERGGFLEKPRRFRQTIWDVIVENVIVVCFFGFQMVVIFSMFWTIIKSP